MLIFVFAGLLALARACSPGSEPGVWSVATWQEKPGTGQPLAYRRIDDSPKSTWFDQSVENPESPFGGSWHTLNRDCQLTNKLAHFWSPTFVRSTTILLFGDSNDSHLLNFLCEEYHRRGGRGFQAFVNSPTILNYCILPSGLSIFQIYVRGVYSGDTSQVYTARNFFLNNTDFTDNETAEQLQGRAAEVERLFGLKPDLIMLSSSYWTLHQFSGEFLDRDEMTPALVDQGSIRKFMRRMKHLVELCHKIFPDAKLAVRTSHEIRTSCDAAGTNVDHSNKRIWGKRAWVSQINAAIRQVAHDTQARLVDLQLMADAFTPRATTSDDIHFRPWLGLELINVILNLT